MFHIIINTERRKPPRDTALAMSTDVVTQTGTQTIDVPVYEWVDDDVQPDTIGPGAEPNRHQVQVGTVQQEVPTFTTQANPPQLHTMGDSVGRWVEVDGLPEFVQDFSSPQIVYAAEWDGVSPYVVVHKGDINAIKMAFAGWPMMTQAEYESLPVVELNQ